MKCRRLSERKVRSKLNFLVGEKKRAALFACAHTH